MKFIKYFLVFFFISHNLKGMDTHLLNYDLFRAAASGDKVILEQLLDRGADINAQKEWGPTPLYYAAESGQLACVKALIDRGADTSLKTWFMTPLDIAIKNGHDACTDVLRDAGARTAQELETDTNPIGENCADDSLLQRWQRCTSAKD